MFDELNVCVCVCNNAFLGVGEHVCVFTLPHEAVLRGSLVIKKHPPVGNGFLLSKYV